MLGKLRITTEVLAGWVLYQFFPRKRLILIAGSMRSGTTLLKALLARAFDVSHLPEVNPAYYASLPPFAAYFKLYCLAKEPVLVLKYPSKDAFVSPVGELCLVKRILIVRGAHQVSDSLLRASRASPTVFGDWTNERTLGYWKQTYKELSSGDWGPVVTVRYEQLVKAPKKTTQTLFEFIGSKQKEGVDGYDAIDWQWGSDDGGGLIRAGKVRNRPEKNEEWGNLPEEKLLASYDKENNIIDSCTKGTFV